MAKKNTKAKTKVKEPELTPEEMIAQAEARMTDILKKSALARELSDLARIVGGYNMAKYDEEQIKLNKAQEAAMSPEEKIIRDRMNKTEFLLIVKGKEYNRNNDRLHNFRRAAEMSRSTMSRELHGMLQKHLVSYYDMLDDIDAGKIPSQKVVDEKLGDIIVYFHLQECVIKETIRKYPKEECMMSTTNEQPKDAK